MENSSDTDFTVAYAASTEASCDDLCLDMVLFQNPKKLRSHTFKHFLDDNEFANTWKNLTQIGSGDISQAHIFLDQIQCPAKITSSKACENDCPSYGQCTYIIDIFEKEYRKIIELIIKGSIEKPLFSVFESTETNGQFLVCLNSRSIVAKAAETRVSKFNLVTCYANNISGECYVEFRNRNIAKIGYEALSGTAQWYSKETWGLAKKKKSKPKKKNIRYSPYKRGGSTNYRQYLEDSFD